MNGLRVPPGGISSRAAEKCGILTHPCFYPHMWPGVAAASRRHLVLRAGGGYVRTLVVGMYATVGMPREQTWPKAARVIRHPRANFEAADNPFTIDALSSESRPACARLYLRR